MTHQVRVEHSTRIEAPAEQVWAYVTDWGKHQEWVPFTHTEAVGGEARAVGGRIRARSGLGPIGFWDTMTITGWDERPDGAGTFAVQHTGRVVRGEAAVTVTADGPGRSTLHWAEYVVLGPVGHLGWRVTGRLVRAGLARVIERLAARVEAQRETGR